MQRADGDAHRSRAVSPVVSTILLVAIAVLLGAVVSVFALGIVEDVDEPAPSASFDGKFTESGTIAITHVVGDTINGEKLYVRWTDVGGTEQEKTWVELGGGAQVSAGDVVNKSGFNGDETVRLVWATATGDRSAILSTFATRNVVAPLSDAAVTTEESTFASVSAAFGSKAWQALGRAGDRGSSGDWEIGIGPNDAGSNGTANLAWQSGTAYPFTLTYNQSGNGKATFALDGKTVDSDVDSFSSTGDTIGFTLVNQTADQEVRLEDLRLDGLRLTKSTATSGVDGNRKTAYTVSKDSIADGFVFTGNVTFSWGANTPSGSEMQLNIEIEEAGTGPS